MSGVQTCALPIFEALRAHPLGAQLILTKSLLFALYTVLRIPAPAVKGIRLRSQPTAPRYARHFVASTLRDWQVPMAIPLACLVASELVTRSTLYDSTGDRIHLTVAWNRPSLRLAVADHTPDVRHRQHEGPNQEERGLATVAGVSRAHGVLHAADGGEVVWAVLDLPDHDPLTYLR